MQAMTVTVAPHPLLDAAVFVTALPHPLGEIASPDWLTERLSLDADAPVAPRDELRTDVRDMLRHGGFKPSGRNKPASEYLVRAAGRGRLGTINAVVDVCNVVSLHSGLPISVIDLDRAVAPLYIAVADEDAHYVFNPSGQEIRVGGLVCLHDADGPVANAVKDSQRTKTDDATHRTLSVVWGVQSDPERTAHALRWYRELLEQLGAETKEVESA